MKDDLTSADGTAVENRIGYGAKRGLICGLFTAWGLAFLHGIFLIVYFLTAYNRTSSDYDTSMMDYVELGFNVVEKNGVYFLIFWSLLIVPAGVIIGAILGAAGIIRKKKPANDSSSSEPEK